MPRTLMPQTTDPETVLSNQTQFSGEEPLFEEPPIFTDGKAVAPQIKKKKSLLPFIALAVFGIFILLLGVLVMVAPRRTTIAQKPIVIQSNANQQQTDALNSRLNEIQSDFQNADPSQQILPFPPVDMNIYLDQPK